MSGEVYLDSSLSQYRFSSGGAASCHPFSSPSSHVLLDRCGMSAAASGRSKYLADPFSACTNYSPSECLAIHQSSLPCFHTTPPCASRSVSVIAVLALLLMLQAARQAQHSWCLDFCCAHEALAGAHKVGCVDLHLVAHVDAQERLGGGPGCRDEAIRCDLMMSRLSRAPTWVALFIDAQDRLESEVSKHEKAMFQSISPFLLFQGQGGGLEAQRKCVCHHCGLRERTLTDAAVSVHRRNMQVRQK